MRFARCARIGRGVLDAPEGGICRSSTKRSGCPRGDAFDGLETVRRLSDDVAPTARWQHESEEHSHVLVAS